MLRGRFPEGKFTLEKPPFDIETESGPCLPDFPIRSRLGDDEVTFDVEVMGYECRGYLRGREVTHTRMETPGTLCMMRASGFDPESGLTARGINVTKTIERVLPRRWSG